MLRPTTDDARFHGEPDTTAMTAAAVAGDDEALGRLLAAYQRPAYNLAFHLLGSEEDAADATQEGFLLAVRAIRRPEARPREIDRFDSWIMRVVANAALQRLRSRRRGSAVSVDELEERLPARDGQEPAQQLERRELRGEVLRAMLLLPDAQRAALILREFEDMSYEQIAEALRISRMAVQMLLFRARRNFRAAYEGLADDPYLIGCSDLTLLLSVLLDGELRPAAWLKLSVHLARCRHCRHEVAELRKARRLRAQVALVPLPLGWAWSMPQVTDGVAPVAAMARGAPAIAEGLVQLGTLGRAAAALAVATAGVTMVTAPPRANPLDAGREEVPPVALVATPGPESARMMVNGSTQSPTEQVVFQAWTAQFEIGWDAAPEPELVVPFPDGRSSAEEPATQGRSTEGVGASSPPVGSSALSPEPESGSRPLAIRADPSSAASAGLMTEAEPGVLAQTASNQLSEVVPLPPVESASPVAPLEAAPVPAPTSADPPDPGLELPAVPHPTEALPATLPTSVSTLQPTVAFPTVNPQPTVALPTVNPQPTVALPTVPATPTLPSVPATPVSLPLPAAIP